MKRMQKKDEISRGIAHMGHAYMPCLAATRFNCSWYKARVHRDVVGYEAGCQRDRETEKMREKGRKADRTKRDGGRGEKRAPTGRRGGVQTTPSPPTP